MAKIMQLAKDLLKGGNKEDIYPRTVDSAVYTTDDNNNPTGNTIKTYFAYLDEELGRYMTTDLYAPNGIIVTPSKTALSGNDPTFGQLVDYAGSIPRRNMYITYSGDGTNYVLPLLYYTGQKLVYAAFIEENNQYIQATITSNGNINMALYNVAPQIDVYISSTGSISTSTITVQDIINMHFNRNGIVRVKMNYTAKDYHLNLEESYESSGIKYLVFGSFSIVNDKIRHIQASISENDTSFTITTTTLP